MTNKFKLLLAAITVAMLGTSCSEDQTSLTIEEIPGTAKIMGQISYQTGTEWNATASSIDDKFAVAANKKVIIEITNSELKSGAQGITVYETTTDAKGNYEIEIPIAKPSMNVTIKAETFAGEMKMFDSMNPSITPATPVYKTNNVFYECSKKFEVNSTTTTIQDIAYGFSIRTLYN